MILIWFNFFEIRKSWMYEICYVNSSDCDEILFTLVQFIGSYKPQLLQRKTNWCFNKGL